MSDTVAPADGDEFAEFAGDPGDAETLPVTTGRDPVNGVLDRVVDDESEIGAGA